MGLHMHIERHREHTLGSTFIRQHHRPPNSIIRHPHPHQEIVRRKNIPLNIQFQKMQFLICKILCYFIGSKVFEEPGDGVLRRGDHPSIHSCCFLGHCQSSASLKASLSSRAALGQHTRFETATSATYRTRNMQPTSHVQGQGQGKGSKDPRT